MSGLSAAALLRALGVDHFVDLETTSEVGEWSLVVTNRRGGYAARCYRGELDEIIGRASRGEPADTLSR